MSETQTTPTETPEPPPPDYKPQHVLASEEQQQPPPQEAQPAAESEDAAAEPKPEKTAEETAEDRLKAQQRREAARIGWLTKQKFAEQKRADAAEAELRTYREQQQRQNGGQPPQMTQEQFDQLVEQRAAQKVAQQAHDRRFSEWDGVGVKEFGEDPFRKACETVANMASDEQRTMLAAMVPDIEGGQKAIMELADNPEEAERILALPPHRMALALAKLAAPEAPKPKPVSTLPPPIRPPQAARARGEPDPEKGSFDDYKRWSSKVEWNRY
jgi:hypothetical protein